MEFPTLKDLPNISNKRVLVRLDLNVPMEGGLITDDFRIKKSLPTIQYLSERGAKLILISHKSDSLGSLKIVAKSLSKYIKIEFLSDASVSDDVIFKTHEVESGSALLLENLRNNPMEEKNDSDYAERLSKLGEIYVLDAFGVSHREHASIVSVPKFLPSFAGLLIEDEVKNLTYALDPEHPFLFIIGGAKTSTKLPLIKKFINIADLIFIGGVLANDFFMKKGYEVGESVVDKDVDINELINNKRILLPEDVVVHNNVVKNPNKLESTDKILDIGPKSIATIKKTISDAKFILWNGPLGYFEDGFKDGTLELAKSIGESDAYSIIGGGDSIVAIHELNNLDSFNFVSSGGGAMLDFLADGTLPGLEALSKRYK